MDSQTRRSFFKGSFVSLAIQLLSAALTFFSTLLIAWLSNDRGFGIYTLVYTWISVLSMVAVFGLDDLLIKWVPAYTAQGDLARLRGILRWANRQVLPVSAATALAFIVFMQLGDGNGISEYALFYYWALASLPFFAWMHLFQSALRGFKQLLWGQVADKLAQPLAFFAWLLLGYGLSDFQLSDEQVIVFRLFSFVLAAALAWWLFRRFAPIDFRSAVPIEEPQTWNRSCRFFMATTLLYALNTRLDILLLGFFNTDPKEIAYYNVALKFSDLLLIPFMGIATAVTPMLARLHAEHRSTQSLFATATAASFALTAMGGILFIVLGDWLLGWYGNSFRTGYTCLVVLCAAKMLHAFVGPVNYLLLVAGQEQRITLTIAISTLATLLLHLVCIPLWGIEGAAFATIGGALVFEIGVGWMLWRRLRVAPTALAIWSQVASRRSQE